ncbi:HEPN domain-containing protein, partial [Thalassospira sp. CH_XMU1420-2]|uniref:HEPN domain-containing protein n=1 Tax=Thalassospira sp. CH_XMU1420-2 TaxID=3107769 RepID=UPI0030082D72
MTQTSSIPALFEEIDDRFGREDGWSYPKSISICWPSSTQDVSDFLQFSQGYYEASKAICGMIQRNEVEDYVVGYAVLYLFRHAIELALKGILIKRGVTFKRDHNLSKLASMVETLPAWSLQWIEEICEMDKKSTGLRYPGGSLKGFEIGTLLPDWEA